MKNSLLIVPLDLQGQAPEWIRIVPLGKVELRDNRPSFEATRADLEVLMQAFRNDGVRLVIDYEHKTLTGDKAPAAGWITDLELRDDGLYARVDWTAEARQEIADKKYGYYSPVLRLEPETRRVQKLMHAGLTNTPAIKNLAPLLAARYRSAGEDAAGALEEPEILILQAGGTPAPPKQEEATAMLKLLVNKLGLKPDATQEEVLALVSSQAQEAVALKAQIAALPEIARAAGLKLEATVNEITGAILALKQGSEQLTGLRTELEALKAENIQGKARKAVDEALTARKISPAQTEWALKYAAENPEGFAAYAAAAVPILAGQEFEVATQDGKGHVSLTADEMAVCKQLNLTPEAFKAQRQTQEEA